MADTSGNRAADRIIARINGNKSSDKSSPKRGAMGIDTGVTPEGMWLDQADEERAANAEGGLGAWAGDMIHAGATGAAKALLPYGHPLVALPVLGLEGAHAASDDGGLDSFGAAGRAVGQWMYPGAHPPEGVIDKWRVVNEDPEVKPGDVERAIAEPEWRPSFTPYARAYQAVEDLKERGVPGVMGTAEMMFSGGKKYALPAAAGGAAGAVMSDAGGKATPEEVEDAAELGALGASLLKGGVWKIAGGLRAKEVAKDQGEVARMYEGVDGADDMHISMAAAGANPEYANELVRRMGDMTPEQLAALRAAAASVPDEASALLRGATGKAAKQAKGAMVTKARAASSRRDFGEAGRELALVREGQLNDIRAAHLEPLGDAISSDPKVGSGAFAENLKKDLSEAMERFKGSDLFPFSRVRQLLRSRGGKLSDAEQADFEKFRSAKADAAFKSTKKFVEDNGGSAEVALEAAEESRAHVMKMMKTPEAFMVSDLMNVRSALQQERLSGVKKLERQDIIAAIDGALERSLGEKGASALRDFRLAWQDAVQTHDASGLVTGLRKLGGARAKGRDFSKYRAELLGGGDHDALRGRFEELAKAFGGGDIKKGAPRAAALFVDAMDDVEAARLYAKAGVAGKLFKDADDGMEVFNKALSQRALQGFLGLAKGRRLDDLSADELLAVRRGAIKRLYGDPAVVDGVMRTAYLRAKLPAEVYDGRSGVVDFDDLEKGLSDLLGVGSDSGAKKFDLLFGNGKRNSRARKDMETMLGFVKGTRQIEQGTRAKSKFVKGKLRKNVGQLRSIAQAAIRPLYFPISWVASLLQTGERGLGLALSTRQNDAVVKSLVERGFADAAAGKKGFFGRLAEAAKKNEESAVAFMRMGYLWAADNYVEGEFSQDQRRKIRALAEELDVGDLKATMEGGFGGVKGMVRDVPRLESWRGYGK